MKTYFRILRYAKFYWKFLTLSVFFTILYALLNGASVYLMIPLLDTLFLGDSANTANAAVASNEITGWFNTLKYTIDQAFRSFVFAGTKIESLIRICLLILGTFILKNVAGYMQAYFLIFVEQGLIRDLRNQVYTHLNKLPMSFFKKERVGNLISRIINDIAFLQTSISATFLNAIREPLTIAVFLGIAFSISWELTLLAFLILPMTGIIIISVGRFLRKQTSQVQAKLADLTSLIQETTLGVKIVKAFGMEAYENKKFYKETSSFFRLNLRITRLKNLSSPTTEILSVLVGVIIMYMGGNMVLSTEEIRASEFVGFILAIFQMMTPIKELGGINNRIQESSAAADRVFEILDTEPDIKDPAQPAELKEFSHDISFDHVTFQYDDGNEKVLDDISFTVKKGEIVALVGPSGSGKSTLVDLIPRFFDPTGGAVLIDGQDIRSFRLSDIRSRIGIVTQETILFNESIRNNIAYGLVDCPMDKIVEVAKIANAHHFIAELPEGYDTNIGERGVKLSGGQRQRLSIARALLKDPEIMIFDEATSSLDNESELLVQEAIDRLMHNRTVVVIAHRLSTIRNASKIVVLERGKIVQEGTHPDLLQVETGLYKKLYEMQFRDKGENGSDQ